MHFLADINVWVALAFRAHAFHGVATAWFAGRDPESCVFCRVTQQGFLRLSTNQHVVGPSAVTLDEAWRFYDAFLDDERVVYADEPAGIEAEWRGLSRRARHSPNIWTEAYLAAFAVAGGYEMVTLDRGFAHFKLPHCTILV